MGVKFKRISNDTTLKTEDQFSVLYDLGFYVDSANVFVEEEIANIPSVLILDAHHKTYNGKYAEEPKEKQ